MIFLWQGDRKLVHLPFFCCIYFLKSWKSKPTENPEIVRRKVKKTYDSGLLRKPKAKSWKKTLSNFKSYWIFFLSGWVNKVLPKGVTHMSSKQALNFLFLSASLFLLNSFCFLNYTFFFLVLLILVLDFVLLWIGIVLDALRCCTFSSIPLAFVHYFYFLYDWRTGVFHEINSIIHFKLGLDILNLHYWLTLVSIFAMKLMLYFLFLLSLSEAMTDDGVTSLPINKG